MIANDVNAHLKGGRYDLVEKKLNQNVKQEVVEVFEDSHTVAVTNRQTLNAKEIAIEAKQTLSLKADQVTAQGAQSLSLKAGNVKIEGTQSVSLKCGGSYVVLSPSGVFITGSTVFMNTGGSPAGRRRAADDSGPDNRDTRSTPPAPPAALRTAEGEAEAVGVRRRAHTHLAHRAAPARAQSAAPAARSSDSPL